MILHCKEGEGELDVGSRWDGDTPHTRAIVRVVSGVTRTLDGTMILVGYISTADL